MPDLPPGNALSETGPLAGVRVVSLAPNLPGPAAAARFVEFGATVTKIEPPSGDFLAIGAPDYYRELVAGQEVITLDLKSDHGQAELRRRLESADILLTSSRPSAMTKLGLGWDAVHADFPELIVVAIVGYPGAKAEVAGHDLTYQAGFGMLVPPTMPRVLVADLAGGERAVSAGLAALVSRSRTGEGSYCEVALSDAAEWFAAPVRHGMTSDHGVLGGAAPQYRIYASSDGYVALAALEPHFWKRFCEATGVPHDGTGIEDVLRQRTSGEWEAWADERDIPLAACR